jgi:hypothetical protein
VSTAAPAGPRSFDPVEVGTSETDAWVAYYRRAWLRLLIASFGLVRAGFGMPWPRTVKGAWYVLRANQLWASYPRNDPGGAREAMRRFYTLVAGQDGGLDLDPVEAARLEVEWWGIHRNRQRTSAASEAELLNALVDLYAYVYGVPPDSVVEAARLRVEAMDLSDAWVAAGCDTDDPLLAEERRALVASYAALRYAVSGDAT